MKTIHFDEYGYMKNDRQIAFSNIGTQMDIILKGINLKEPNHYKIDWDKIDHDTKEMEERDAVDTENHDCGLVGGGEGSCDNLAHENHD